MDNMQYNKTRNIPLNESPSEKEGKLRQRVGVIRRSDSPQ